MRIGRDTAVRTTFCSSLATALLAIAPSAGAQDAIAGAAIEFHRELADTAPALNLAMDVEDTETIDEVNVTPAFGTADTWRLNFQGGGGIGTEPDDDSTFGFAGVGFSYFLVDNFSLELEFNFIGFQQIGPDAFGGNFNFLVRWHIIAQPTWSFYLDGGAGMMLTTEDVPQGTQNFNFTPQAGFGFSFEVADDTRLFIGMRIHHLSNANLNAQNEGVDSFMAYAGISLPF